MEMLRRPLTKEEIRGYREDGIVCLRGLFDTAWIDLLRRATDEVLVEYRLSRRPGDPSPGRFLRTVLMWTFHPAFHAFAFRSPAGAIAAQLMGSQRVLLYGDNLLIKEPGAVERTPWHQDQPYFKVNGSQICSLWLAFDRVTADTGAVEFIRGSHRWGRWFRPVAFDSGGKRKVNESLDRLEDLPDIEGRRDAYDIVRFDLEPGDCTVHHGLTLHGAPGNRSSHQTRRGLSLRLLGEDATYVPRHSDVPTPADAYLRPGGPIECAQYPCIWAQRPYRS
jgi:ectoine hydroxylase-related dioxygenase (phytanoyl-CoA dioxygenase family)